MHVRAHEALGAVVAPVRRPAETLGDARDQDPHMTCRVGREDDRVDVARGEARVELQHPDSAAHREELDVVGLCLRELAEGAQGCLDLVPGHGPGDSYSAA